MKKGISVILAVLLAVSCLTGLSGCGSSKKTTLYVYNWGQYISEGDDGSLDVIAAFEEAYPNIRVQYSTYDSNEIMYSKLANGGITVDVIIPSDYMIGRMVQEGMLEELNFSNIPNYQYIDDSFKTPPTTRRTSIPSPTPGAPWVSSTTPSTWTKPTSPAGNCCGTRSTPERS